LDQNQNVLQWSSEEMSIPYYSPVDQKMHKYYPDFLAKIKKIKGEVETFMIEVKPKKQTQPPTKKKKKTKTYINECMTYSINEAKWKNASEYCRKNGWKFIILTEDIILP